MDYKSRVEKYLFDNPDRAEHFRQKEKNIDWSNPNAIRQYRRQQYLKKHPIEYIFGDRNPEYCAKWAYKTLHAHKQFKYIINITVDELVKLVNSTNFCKYCGIQLNWCGGKRSLNSPDLDRRYNENIISIDNIDIICASCNRSKKHESAPLYMRS